MNLRALLLVCSALCAPAFAAEPLPTEASVRELLVVTEAKQLIDNSMSQIDAAIQSGVQQSLQGRELTPEQEKILDEMRTNLLVIFGEEFTWTKLEPTFIDVYRRSLSQSEVDGMIAFYKTTAGRAVIAKMPLIMQNSMQMVQSQLGGMMPRIQQVQREAVEKLEKTTAPP
jgi:hypothetical protein